MEHSLAAVNADAVLKGTNVDGVYDCNSRNNNVTFEHISFRELVSSSAPSMDMMAMTFCEENRIPGWYIFCIHSGLGVASPSYTFFFHFANYMSYQSEKNYDNYVPHIRVNRSLNIRTFHPVSEKGSI